MSILTGTEMLFTYTATGLLRGMMNMKISNKARQCIIQTKTMRGG